MQDGSSEVAGESGASGGGADPMAFSNDAHRGVLTDFLDALDAGRDPLTNGRAALKVHWLIDALLESSRSARPIRPRNG